VAIQEKDNMRKIILQKMTRISKETYREHRRANKICRERKREMLKRHIESIEVDQERADTRKYYQTVKRFSKGLQHRLNACKDNSGKLTEGDDKILEHWARYFKSLFEKEYNEEEESDEEVYLTAEPLVKELLQEEMERAICNLKIRKAPGEDDIVAEFNKNASQELKSRLYALIRKIWRDEKMPDNWKIGLIVRLFKKGDEMKCKNYRGVTLLNVTYKVLSSVILEGYSEEIMGEYECGFRPQRRITDQLFVVRQILEKFYANDSDLHLLFIDLKKSFQQDKPKKAARITSEFWDTQKYRTACENDT